MHDTRIVSVASGDGHCLALSGVGEVYSWGDGSYDALGPPANCRAYHYAQPPSRLQLLDLL